MSYNSFHNEKVPVEGLRYSGCSSAARRGYKPARCPNPGQLTPGNGPLEGLLYFAG